MINVETRLKVIDNFGANYVKVIRLLGGSFKKVGTINNYVIVVVIKSTLKKKLKKKIYLGLIVGIKKWYKRNNGNYLRFKNNMVLILQGKNKIYANRIFGTLPKEVKKLNLLKLTTLVKSFI